MRLRLWLSMGVAAVAALAAAGEFGAPGASTGAAAARDRVVTDMPDDVSGPQVHFLYVIPRDGEDRGLDTSSAIEKSVSSWQAWLMKQTGDRVIRVDTYRGQLDLSFFRLNTADAVVASQGPYVREQIEEELYAAGYNSPTKIYAVYYDGSSSWSCGGADPQPTFRGSVAAIYLKGTPPGAPPCSSNPLGVDPPGYFEFGMLHELVHTLGFVPRCAPHARGDSDAGHVSDSRHDLMWSGNEPWGTNEPALMQLDVGRDDYYGHGRSNCPDLSASPYLAPLHSVSVTVSGPGRVTSSPPGIDCPGSCTGKFAGSVTLTATPSAGALFTGWAEACSGTATCVVTGEGSVTASFVTSAHRRTLSLRVRALRATGALRVVDGYAPCGVRVLVVVERSGKRGWSLVRRVPTDSGGVFTVSLPRGRATYRARAPEGTAEGEKCLKAVSRTVATSG